MSVKNALPPYKVLNAVDISTNQTSPVIDILNQDNVGIILSWSGASPVGTIKIQCASPLATELSSAAWDWIDLDFGSVIGITGNTGTHNISINQAPFAKLRIVYTSTSGTGSLTAACTAKRMGG